MATAAVEKEGGRRSPSPVVLVALLTTMLCLMLLAFAAPAIHSGARDLPLAVSGPQPAVAQVKAALDKQSPGAFTVLEKQSAAEVSDAIKHRDAIGGLELGAQGVTIHIASAAGAPYSALLKGIGGALQAQGQKVTYVDEAPFTADDPTGAGLTALALPLIFGGMATAMMFSQVYKGSRLGRICGALTIAAAGGLATTAILQFGFGSFENDYWLTSLAVAGGIAAISMTILGLEQWLGYAGLGIGAITMLFVANPLSGMATGPRWLPAPWGTIGQFLPVGAANTAIRSSAFFDGHGATRAFVVLGCWVLLGLVLTITAPTRKDSAPQAAPDPAAA